MNAKDRFEAIKRHPEHIEGRNRILKQFKLVEAKYPGILNKVTLPEFLFLLAKDRSSFSARRSKFPENILYPVLVEMDKMGTKWGPILSTSAVNVIEAKDVYMIPFVYEFLAKRPKLIKAALGNERYLGLRVDLTAKKADILKEFEDYITLFRKHVKRPQTRERKTLVDPWKVYDMHHKEGKSLLKIAKEIFDFKTNPSYDPKAKAKYEQVRAAYRKACKMIKQVTPTA